MFVVDASVVLAWSFPDEQSGLADRAIDRLLVEGGIAPPHWPLEIAQAFSSAERRGRIAFDDVTTLRSLFVPLPVDIVPLDLGGAFDSLDLARAHNLTAYDAAYLDLARARGLGLATVDQRLAAACRTVGVPLID